MSKHFIQLCQQLPLFSCHILNFCLWYVIPLDTWTQGELGGGTTWHATGLMGILKSSPLETKIACMSRDLYLKLEERGWYTGFKQCGSLYVASKKDRMYQYRYAVHM